MQVINRLKELTVTIVKLSRRRVAAHGRIHDSGRIPSQEETLGTYPGVI